MTGPRRRDEVLYQEPAVTEASRRLEEALRQERVDVMTEGVNAWMEAHPEEQKEIIKQAIDEWLDSQILRFGKFSIWTLIAGATAAILYLWLMSKGLKN